jgi:hypothetical protein
VGRPLADRSRHGLFRYLTADESADYLAIMDLFSATLLTDLSAAAATRHTPMPPLSPSRVVVTSARVVCRPGPLMGVAEGC